MSERIITLAQAEDDIESLARFIAQKSPASADRFLNAVHQTFLAILPLPHLGRPWETASPQYQKMRWWPVRGFRSHLIFYRPVSEGIEVLRVVHGSRNLPSLFTD
jgi:toxin ParE1/3/4